VRGLAYANSYGTDNAGGWKNPSPGNPHLSFPVILEKGKCPLLQTFTPLFRRVNRISSKWVV